MTDYFAEFYCKEKGIKPEFCTSSMGENSHSIDILYRLEGQTHQDTLLIGSALELMAKHISKLEGHFTD